MGGDHARVSPFAGDQSGIPLSALDPDINGDGKIDDWEKEVYGRIVKADTDNTGTISVRNLFDFIKSMSAEVKEAAKGGIPIVSLNPDTDGDGKVEAWEVDVFERIKEADADKSGSISVKELFGVIKDAAESDRQKKLFRRLFIATAVLLLLMLAANMALTAAVVFLAKDTLTPPTGVSTTTSGEPLRPGAYSIGATPKTARARRLREFHGRTLVEVGTAEGSNCEAVLAAAQASGENKGNARVNTAGGGTTFAAGQITSTAVEGGVAVTTVTGEAGGAGATFEVHDCGSVLAAVERARMRQLSTTEARSSRRRLAVGLDDQLKPLEAGCLLYHCFEGDADCDNPSPRDACAAWEEGDGGACLEPLCAYVLD